MRRTELRFEVSEQGQHRRFDLIFVLAPVRLEVSLVVVGAQAEKETPEVALPAGKLAHTYKVVGPFDSPGEPTVVLRKVAADHGQVERAQNRGGGLALEEEVEAPLNEVLDRIATRAAAPSFQVLARHCHDVVCL